MPRRGIAALALVLAAGWIYSGADGAVDGTRPQQALVAGVPFISWNEASTMSYEGRDVLNPSYAASMGMILKYWGQDLKLLKHAEKAVPLDAGGWARVESRQAKDLDELKALIAEGIPVLVDPALTPYAHPPTPWIAVMTRALETKDAVRDAKGEIWMTPQGPPMIEEKLAQEWGPRSSILGRLSSSGEFDRMREHFPDAAWDSLFVANRVVIGYDDGRRILVLHDPSFGPAWEIDYDAFDTMWAFQGRRFVVFRPNPGVTAVPSAPVGAYSSRTPSQLAAEHFVFGEALAAVGKLPEAKERFEKGLALADVSPGLRHLLLVGSARVDIADRRHGDAAVLAREANEIFPNNPRAWQILAEADTGSGGAKKVQELCVSRVAERTAFQVLGRDFLIYGCGADRPLWPPK